MSNAAATLRAAADLIERTGWTQDELALDAEGDECAPDDPDASCFCAMGAILCVTAVNGADSDPGEMALQARVGTVVAWNDREDQTAENVVATMRRVAAEIEGSEGR